MKKILIISFFIFSLYSCNKLEYNNLNNNDNTVVKWIFSDYNFRNCIEEQKEKWIEGIKEQEKKCIKYVINNSGKNNGYTNSWYFTDIIFSDYNFNKKSVINKNLTITINNKLNKENLEKIKKLISNNNIETLNLYFRNYNDKYFEIFNYKKFLKLNSILLDLWTELEQFDLTLEFLKNKINSSKNFTKLEIFFNDYKLTTYELNLFKEINLEKLWLNWWVSDNKQIRYKQLKEILSNSKSLIELWYLDYWVFRKKDRKIIFEQF